ncbi:MAG: hypothetical protein F6K23_35835 [Okeania sp. SIO2C9]|uniref:hypothetical protein n=1 Tax=Okeania sp. SIO2C9 TaxID=2607791 RepID=UPI0013C03C6A|nr:hypothetical protein [Okeania sp. SIO2C9]NEQ77913.1 hypothetical protein [Okeania sp. SIO2C9]
MTKKRAEKLQPEVILQIEEIISHNSYQRLLICASKNYFYVLQGYDKFIKSDLSLEITTGAIGKKLVSLYTWLYGHSGVRSQESGVRRGINKEVVGRIVP